MKLYNFTVKAIVAAPDEFEAKDLILVSRAIKEAYQCQFMNAVFMSNVAIQAELIDEITIS